MSLYQKLFGNQQQQVTASTPDNNQQQQPQNKDGTQSNGQPKQNPGGESLQLGGPGAVEKTKTGSPLDGYADLWKNETTENKDGQGNNPPQNQPAPGTQNQPQVPEFVKQAKTLNFSKNIPRELAAKALQGDVDSFFQVIEHVGRGAFASAAHYSEKHYATGSSKLKEEITGSFPEHFRQLSIANTPIKHPILSKPGVKPMVEGIRLQFAEKFPDAPPEELQQKAEQYFIDFHKEMGISDETTQQQTARQGADVTADRQKAQAEGKWDWDKDFGI